MDIKWSTLSSCAAETGIIWARAGRSGGRGICEGLAFVLLDFDYMDAQL